MLLFRNRFKLELLSEFGVRTTSSVTDLAPYIHDDKLLNRGGFRLIFF